MTQVLARVKFNNVVRWGIVDGDLIYAINGDVYTGFSKSKKLCLLEEAELMVPAEPRIMVLCGMNYMDHILEMEKPVPSEPALMLKPPNTLAAPGSDIVYPRISDDLRSEAELCAVIKKPTRNVTEAEALDHVLGYTCGNDITALDVCRKDGRPIRCKAFDTSGPLGPYLVTGIDPQNLSIKQRVNGQLKQDSSTSLMIFKIKKLISYISEFMTLLPGDVVWSGTPKGGAVPLEIGDITEVEIENIGILRNKIIPGTDR